MSAKMGAGAVMLVAYAALSGHLAHAGSLTATQWAIVAGTGLILLAFTVTTTFALRAAPAIAVTAIGMASPPVTFALQLAAGQGPRLTAAAAWSMVLVVAGAAAFLVSRRMRGSGPVQA
jgi:hypothetical protein